MVICLLHVDHKPLVHLVTNQLSLIMQGWIDNLLLYDFMTEYLAGDENNLADALFQQFKEISNVEVCAIEVEQEESKLDQKLKWEAAKSLDMKLWLIGIK